jgi:hypothetical protein
MLGFSEMAVVPHKLLAACAENSDTDFFVSIDV